MFCTHGAGRCWVCFLLCKNVYRLRWYGHVMRKGGEDWVKKCMEYRVEGRRPVGRPRKTWLESVEADMAELEIDKEDVHDRSKWRRNVNVIFSPVYLQLRR